MGITYNPKVVTDGLVFCVDAASKRSYPGTGTTWTDLAGGNNGTLTNGPTFSSANGGCLVFDGSDDYVLLGNDVNLGTSASITVWVKGLGDEGTVAGATSPTDGGYILGTTVSGISSYVRMYPDNDGVLDRASISNSFTDIFAEWTHLSISRDVLTVYLYVNGVANLITTYNNSGTMATAGTRVKSIGARDTGSSPMEGQIACLQLYNRALTADEVRQNYNATRGRFGL